MVVRNRLRKRLLLIGCIFLVDPPFPLVSHFFVTHLIASPFLQRLIGCIAAYISFSLCAGATVRGFA
ncbi:hypothetical protein F4781DRAFT_385084 [Annulohypoxylon bovei var. microspora]|nr:hypothetical protein F4781DRAFT_385084 [Annulohypoxylon bovei var. microspora]